MQPIPETLKPIDPAAPSQPTLLAEQVQQLKERQRGDFVSNLQTVAGINPDQFAKATHLERLTGIPADVLHKQADKLQMLLQGNKYAGVYDNYARTARALADGKTAALAQDDIDNLTRIEHAALRTKFDEQSWADRNVFSPLKKWLAADRQGASLGYASDLQRLGEQFDAIDAEISRASAAGEQPYAAGGAPEAFGRDYLLATPEGRAEMRANLQAGMGGAVESIGARESELQAIPVDPGAVRAQELGGGLAGTASALTDEPAYATRSMVESAPNMVWQLAVGAMTGPVGAAVAGFGAEYRAKTIDVLREAGVDLSKPSEVLRALQDDELMAEKEKRSALKAAGTTLVDLLGFSLAGKLLAPVSLGGKALSGTQRELVNLAAQFPVQGGLEAAGEAAGQFAADGKVDGGEVLMEGLAGAGMSTFDVLTFGGDRLIGAVRDGLAKARHAKMAAQGLGDMVDSALSSKLRGRDAETFRKVTEEQLRDSQLESVWIPAEELARLNQSGMVNLPGLLDEVPGLGEQFAEASARGGSVQIKTSDYLTHFADLHEQLADHVRVKVDGMSVADISAWEQEQAAEIEDLANQMREQVDPVREAATNMVGELMNAGFARQDAEQYAAAHVSVLANLAQRTGRTLEDLQQQFPLDVRGEAPQQLQRAKVDDVRLALGRLRAGDIPKPSDMFGKSLVEYLRDAGGVDDTGGELAALDADEGRVGRNRIGRAGGMSLDDAAMHAWERGYFPGVAREEVGPQLIVDAVREELAGNPRYSVEQENATLRDQADILQRLQDYLDQQGIDLNTATDDQVIERLSQPEGQQYQQDSLPQAAMPRLAGNFEQARVAAKEFQGKELVNTASGIRASVSRNNLDKMLSKSAVSKSTSAADQSLAVANLDHLFTNAIHGWSKPDRYGDVNIVAIHRLFAPMETDQGLRVVKLTVKEFAREDQGNKIYSVEALEIKSPASIWVDSTVQADGLDPTSTPYAGPVKTLVENALERNEKAAIGTRTDTTDSGATDDTARRSSGPDETLEEIVRKLYQSSAPDNGDSRGFITFTPKGQGKRKFKITLTAKRDLSTLIHELGHFYLEVLGELIDADAPPQLKADYDAILRWLGVTSIDQISTEQHEQWARGFERYLAEGKAPNPELQGAFARFKRWLLAIYKDLTRLNVELTDEIRGVMDRLVASDEQIEAANQVVQAMPLFEDAKKAGMTDEEYQAYVEQVELAGEDARVSVEQEIIREEERRRSKWWSEELGRIRNEVAEEIDLLPEYQVQKALRKGVMPDGREVDLKLQTGEIRERYGLGVLRKLSFLHAKEGGMPMDMVANLFGYGSGDEMVKAVLAAPSRSDAIEIEAQQRMRERHGTKASGEAAEKAMAAVHNERRADVMLKELQALAKQGNRKQVTSQQVLRLAAERIMQQRRVRDIQPFEYQRAEAKAGRLAFDAAAKGDLDAAYQHKQQQLLNFHLYRQAVKARDSVDSIVDRMKGYSKQSKREKLGKAGQEYLDQIDTLMEQYEFRTVSLRELNRRTSFLAWYQDQLAAGNEPFVPEFILQTKGRTNYRDLSLEQLQELDEFAKHIDHLAGLKNKLLANKRVKDRAEAEALLIGALTENLDAKPSGALNDSSRDMPEVLRDWLAEGNSSLMKLEQIIEMADGGDPNGPWSSIFWQPLAEAQHRRDDLNKQVTRKIIDATNRWFNANGARAGNKVHIKSLGKPLDFNGILAVALNSGNASNLDKMLRGNKWDQGVVDEILSHMTEADWRYVSEMWEIVNSLWPDIVTLERQVNGIEPEKVEGISVQTPFGVVQGGYWPLVYDPLSAEYSGVLSAVGNQAPLNEQGGVRATTPRGHTKARIDGFAAPIMLDVTVIAGHLQGVIHDLTHRVPLAEARKLVTSPAVRAVMTQRLGKFQTQQFVNVLDGIVNDLAPGSAKGAGVFRRVMNALRSNAAVAWMGYSVTTIINQLGGYSQAMDYFAQKGGRKEYMRALAKFAVNPMHSRAMVLEMSGEMRNRDINLDPAIRQALEQVIRVKKGDIGDLWTSTQNGYDAIRRFAFVPMQAVQSLVDTPVWMAAYEMEGGASNHEAAVQAADRAVRLTQMAGGAKDMAPIQQSELAKFFMPVYAYASLLWNRNVEIARSANQAVKERDVGAVLVALERFIYLNVFPAILANAVKGGLPDDDGEDDDKFGDTWPEFLALQALLSMANGVPLARDAANGLFSDFGYGGISPFGGGIDSAIRATNSTKAETITTNTISAVGMLTGLPSSQINRAVRTYFALEDGELEDDAAAVMQSVLFGPTRKD